MDGWFLTSVISCWLRVRPNKRQRKESMCTTLSTSIACLSRHYGVDVSPNEYSEIANRLLIQTRLRGNKAPAISALTTDVYAALVIFYESDCPNCIDLLEDVKKHFSLLENNHIRVISLSSDTDKEVFENFASHYPWKDKLCDLQGFSSPDFKHWGVAATPSLYYIDEEDIVNDPYGMEEFKFLKH
ncbi:peroxiredoxin family protein [Dysgonomonas sp. ZJ279]|uniref:peroxiredoxin family protein n=1 Tax=Dysgonomonas sp. ZJ279 TaxID=2709796 RepID=UPI0013ED5654|nr:thioredoxin-like domain-containing protein [Dysgonomonas sp. ZJ279]